MKKSDIMMIVLIASASMFISFLVVRNIFGDKYSGSVKVQTIEKISSDISKPSSDIFNKDAINPTIQVQINEKSDLNKTPGTQ